MLDYVKDLFDSYDFVARDTGKGLLFSHKEASSKKSFWLVVSEKEPNSIIVRQSELFVACKTVCQDDALDKNISLLILWETGGKLDHINLSRNVMNVEEDAFFFKKHVLYYSVQEQNALCSAMNGKSFSAFMKEHVESKETFKAYKADPHAQCWQSLLYRTVMKLPFVQLRPVIVDGLESLFISNEARLKRKDEKLAAFNESYFRLMEKRTVSDIKLEKAEEAYAALLPLLGGISDGN